jgi:acetyl esterase
MDVHPQIRQALEALAKAGLPAIETLSPAQARDQINAMARARGGQPAAIERTEDRTVPGPAGPIPVRVYWPNVTAGAASTAGGTLPAILYFHGGGHVIGNLDTHDRIVRNLCAGAEAAIVSVDYRMGPEHKFPAAVDDAWAALRWLAGTASGLAVDPARIAVCGDSAGANLAAVLALLARDAGGPALRAQALIYPVADYGLNTPSYERYASGYGVLTRAAMAWFRNQYLVSPADAEDWRASPLKAGSFLGVAPAIVITAECDVLHDEGAKYAEALRQAGALIEYEDCAGMIHGFFGMAPDVDAAVIAQARISAALKRALA